MSTKRSLDPASSQARAEVTAKDFSGWIAGAGGADAEAQIGFFLMHRYGPMLTRDQLVSVLGFPSSEAFERAVQRGSLNLNVVRIPNRRGMYALAPDVAKYLVEIAQVESDLSDERRGER